MKKNVLFLLIVLIFTSNPVLGMKRKRQDDDPNPRKRRKISPNEIDDSSSRKKNRPEDDDTLRSSKKMNLWKPKKVSSKLEEIPNDVLSEWICSFLTFADLHSLKLTNKNLYENVKFFCEKILHLNLYDINDLLFSIFYQKISGTTHIYMVIAMQALEDFDTTKINIERIIQNVKESNHPLVIALNDPQENFTMRRIRKMFKEIPTLKALYIDENPCLKDRVKEAKCMDEQRDGLQRGLGNYRFDGYRENLQRILMLVKLKRLHLESNPYYRQQPEARMSISPRPTQPAVTVMPYVPTPPPTLANIPQDVVKLEIFSCMTDQELEKMRLVSLEYSNMVDRYLEYRDRR